MSKESTYLNTGSMKDYLQFLISETENSNRVGTYFRCYCKILHEYQDFAWIETDEAAHIIKECDGFVEYTDGSEQGEQQDNKHDMKHGTTPRSAPSLKS